MKTYADRFKEMIMYIETNLDADLNIEMLCQRAKLSKFHFHRQFSAFTGISVMSFVKLLQLKRAAYQLAFRSEQKILEIALVNGYESHEAFSRAFKKYFNYSPSAFRRSPDWSLWQTQYEPVLTLRNRLMKESANFNVTIVDFPEILAATLEHKGSPDLLGKSIARFIEWRKKNKLPPSKSRTFNLVYDDREIADADFRFDLCCAVEKPVQDESYGIFTKTIAAGQCARIRHVGSDDTLDVAVHYLYSEWLPASNRELRDFPLFLERVSFFPDVPESEMITDIYLPLQ